MLKQLPAPHRQTKAAEIAQWLGSHQHFKSHGRAIGRDKLRQRGLVVEDLEQDQQTQDLALSIFHATTHTFNMTGAVKIIENHLGKAFVKAQQTVVVQVPGQQPPASP